jgi:hypothetical protein
MKQVLSNNIILAKLQQRNAKFVSALKRHIIKTHGGMEIEFHSLVKLN